ncbi:hypothetical protein [Spiroplasma endosymbiont of Agriotes lineatus]|uniref:hypothetical protein n=1 Tax=Spiroplasma endosymbiont of Agriotes lineatus TaxID=3077930 RepID=UPI0030CFCBE5
MTNLLSLLIVFANAITNCSPAFIPPCGFEPWAVFPKTITLLSCFLYKNLFCSNTGIRN